ncbi:hypothetical protein O9993_14160 [Vibrio lentus]|nr:hypothetical protein [Vibrio lentus]
MKSKSQGFTLATRACCCDYFGCVESSYRCASFFLVFSEMPMKRGRKVLSAFRNSVDMCTTRNWLVDGEPDFNQVVNYSEGDVYPSETGFPISVLDALPPTEAPTS